MRTTKLIPMVICLGIGGVSPYGVGATEPWVAEIPFVAGWRTLNGEVESVLQIGTLYRCGPEWCGTVEEFSGKANHQRHLLSVRHRMNTPYRKANCSDGPASIVEGRLTEHKNAKLLDRNDGFEMELGAIRYSFMRDPETKYGYVLDQASLPEGLKAIDQVVGFAFQAKESSTTLIRLEQLGGKLSGEMYHKNTHDLPSDLWRHSTPSANFSQFAPDSSGSMAGLSRPSRSAKAGTSNPMWVHSTVVLLSPKAGKVKYVLHEYGHDFNLNGCFDDFGHNKLMLPAMHGGSAIGFVFIEYTPDNLDGIPMLSVGRYVNFPARHGPGIDR